LVEVDILIKDMNSSIKRLEELLDNLESKNANGNNVIENVNELVFDNVSFSINNEPILDKTSFTAQKGDIIGIVGANGSGKTTLSYLINGLLEHDGISINGMNSRSIDKFSYISRVSSVSQVSYLYPDSVKNNLTNYEEVPLENVKERINYFGLNDFFTRFGNEYDKLINDKNLNLSGGEKQAISFIRSVSSNHDVIILDEIDNSLDKNVLEQIIYGLKKMSENRIIFIISHENDLISICNKTVQL